ncbi:MAG TPA: aldo/keto reductase [Candidatus Limnocylindria bacterium]|nr:aldo/keto reductase [Candidatus Limnocylindria bacterium]
MEYTTLGRTGLRVSVAGLGCGGPSRLGMRNDPKSADHAVAMVKQALNLGVNFLDTAQSYGTEPIVGKAIAGVPRERLVISTKKTLPPADHADPQAEVVKGLEQSLKLLGTDYIDVYHLHGVEPTDYEFAKHRLMPAMRRLKEQGKIRLIGVTEGFATDWSHAMLQESLGENMWDVVMVGFSLLNPSARKTVFPLAVNSGVGVLNMFAVRRALSQPERLRALCRELVEKGAIGEDALDVNDPLGFLMKETDAASLPEAAYRFCRHQPGVDVVLTGTGNPEHLKENVAAILKPPLPNPALQKLESLFGNLDYLTGN